MELKIFIFKIKLLIPCLNSQLIVMLSGMHQLIRLEKKAIVEKNKISYYQHKHQRNWIKIQSIIKTLSKSCLKFNKFDILTNFEHSDFNLWKYFYLKSYKVYSLTDHDKIYKYYIIKPMNHLEFSPISEKDEESLETFSFLHKQIQSQAPRPNLLLTQGCKKLADRLTKSFHNRKSYGFQLLKQFILFSSDQETIEIHYKYMHYQLELGVSYLQNSYGLKLKLTLGKAFEDIRNFSRKKKVYQNPLYVNKLVSVYDKVLNLTKKESYRSVIKILAKFIEKQVSTTQGVISQENRKDTVDLIENLQKQISYSQFEKVAPNSNQISSIISQNSVKQSDLKCTKKQNFFKTKKFQNFQQQKRENSNWKEEVQSIDSYQQEPENQQLRMIVKSMSNQIHDYPHSSISDRKMIQNKSRQTKCMSISVTPAKPCSQEYIFQTKKKKSLSSQEYQENQKVVQSVIIVRGSKTYTREPDRFIRVPVVSDEIKIVQMMPEKSNRRLQKIKEYKKDNKGYKINERKIEITSSNSSQRKQPKTEGKSKKNQIILNLEKFTSKFCLNESQQYSDNHSCFGCKYCEIVKDMQTYRIQRTSRLSGGMSYL